MKNLFYALCASLVMAGPALGYDFLPHETFSDSGTGAMSVTLDHPEANMAVDQIVFTLSANATTSESLVCSGQSGGKISENMLGADNLLLRLEYLLDTTETFTCTYPGSDGLDWTIDIKFRRHQ